MQDPLHLQAAVALFRFGTYGNAASIQQVASKFGISEGSVVNFTNRVIEFLCSLMRDWVCWPDAEERRKLGTDSELKGCLGYVDGTDIPLAEAPSENKEVYWSRKKKYCLQAQIICDKNKKIRSIYTGFPGSVHDAKVFQASEIGRTPERFFSEGEFIIGDSAYPLTVNTIVPFKRRIGLLDAQKRQFNAFISSMRVAIEHVNGILKGRFQSLLSLRVRVNQEQGHRQACRWVQACIVLYNMLHEVDEWTSTLEPELLTHSDSEDGAEEGLEDNEIEVTAVYKRNVLMEEITKS